MPGWVSCASSIMVAISDAGMTSRSPRRSKLSTTANSSLTRKNGSNLEAKLFLSGHLVEMYFMTSCNVSSFCAASCSSCFVMQDDTNDTISSSSS
uniref:Uncharacterized protein n=1 Tax=Ixodes ricinus TaxID=34613 RepID=A0A6B0U5Y4_IXORI